MLPIISGTIYNAGKMAALDSKWQQKKESGKIFEKEMTAEEKQLQRFQEELQQMREKKPLNDIRAKLKGGQELTAEEADYLQKNDPALYKEYLELKKEKEAYERELKNCKTKEDVERVRLNKMGSFLAEAKNISSNPNIPKGKKRELMEKLLMKVNGVQSVHADFVNSASYANLPTEEELAKESKDKAKRSEDAAKELGEDAAIEESGDEAANELMEGTAKGATNETTEEVAKDAVKRAAGETTEEITKAAAIETAKETAKKGAASNAAKSEGKDFLKSPGKIIIAELDLPELQKKAENAFETVKTELKDYLRKLRPSGSGLDIPD